MEPIRSAPIASIAPPRTVSKPPTKALTFYGRLRRLSALTSLRVDHYLPAEHGRTPLPDHGPASGRDASGAEALLAQGEGARRPELPPPQAAHARPRPPYGVRGSPLPERRRVLGA